MNGFYVFTSNRLEILAEHLARVVREPLSDLFSPEIIVVQSSGIQRWVSMALARHNGICANTYFPFPNRFLNDLFSRMDPDLPEKSLFDPGVMTLRIMQLLPECLENPEFQNLQAYLAGDKKKLKLYQLAQKIADTFDQYLVFRPDMMFSWEAGRADHWQAVLWRKLSIGTEARHRASLRDDLMNWIRTQPSGTRVLPERVSIFGISYLPPFHLEALEEISKQIPIYFYLMNPCKEYWADIVSQKEKVRYQRKMAVTRAGEEHANLHLESGNRLLASLGALGRDFFRRISATDFNMDDRFRDPGRNSLLTAVQADLLDLTEPAAMDNSSTGNSDADRSVQIHACHSPMREVEVLYDHLLDILASDPGLMPKDIVVMTPDIETYRPYIQAVFDIQDDIGVRIPFTIADRSLKRESRAIEAFLSIMDLKDSRFGAARIVSLLEYEVVREKFGLSEADLETVVHWIVETHIRWGQDAASRSGFGSAGFSENSWRQGIDRLLLGYSMPGYEKNMFHGILPYDPIEGANSLILGKFLEFIEQLFQHVNMLDKYNKLDGWSLLYNAMLEKFIHPSETAERDIQILRKIFGELAETEALSGYHDAVSFEVVRAIIEERLDKENYGHGFISGGLTFCAMLPMRSIPFKVVCLMGMNSDSFPRETRPLGFDLMAKNPRPGDRSRRNDDKYLFLEALVSAREKLYISYIGQSLQDNSEIPPSVLVSELIDYMESGYNISKDRIVTRHPLQAFSPVYFGDSDTFFSYSRENLLGAARLVENAEEKQNPPAFISDTLPIPLAEMDKWKQIDLKDLCAFWANPTKFLLQRRLDIYLGEEKLLPEERENFNVDPLERYLLGQQMVEQKISGGNAVDLLSFFKAQGRLPVGAVGRVVFQTMESDADVYVNKSRPFMAQQPLASVDINFDLGGFRLFARLEGIYPSVGLVHFHFANLQVKYLLTTWTHHLFHNLYDKAPLCGQSFLVCKDAVWEFLPVLDAKQILLNLINFYWEGLSKPFHFFPEASFEYARRLLQKNKNQTAALSAAQQKWAGSDFHRGESQDPYLSLVYSRSDPFDEQFHGASVSVFNPVFHYGREL
ncbi:MAG: exodeoxyribonuclease V subunit gamma [Desulfobacterales bacterium]|nr:exodeoxyribonuclease V subunit gamma [Desulfobacterales bacterium]